MLFPQFCSAQLSSKPQPDAVLHTCQHGVPRPAQRVGKGPTVTSCCDTSRTRSVRPGARLKKSELAATPRWIHLPRVASVRSRPERRASACDDATPDGPRTGFHSASLLRLFIVKAVRGFPSKIVICATMRGPAGILQQRITGWQVTPAHVHSWCHPEVLSSPTVLCFKRMIYCFKATG